MDASLRQRHAELNLNQKIMVETVLMTRV